MKLNPVELLLVNNPFRDLLLRSTGFSFTPPS